MGAHILGTVEIAQARTTAAIQDVKQQAVVAALRFHRPEEPPIRRKMHPTTDVPWSQLQVRNELVRSMIGINGKRDGAIELLVGTYLSKGLFLGKGPSRCDQQFGDCHRIPPLRAYPLTRLCLPFSRSAW